MENYQKVDTKRYSVPPEPHEIRVASRLAIKDIVSRAVEFLEVSGLDLDRRIFLLV